MYLGVVPYFIHLSHVKDKSKYTYIWHWRLNYNACICSKGHLGNVYKFESTMTSRCSKDWNSPKSAIGENKWILGMVTFDMFMFKMELSSWIACFVHREAQPERLGCLRVNVFSNIYKGLWNSDTQSYNST